MRKTSFAIFALIASILASTVSAQIVPFGTMSGGGGASNGAAVPGCSAITAIASVVSGTFTCNPASVANGTATTAGRSILTIRDTISGSSATSNFLNITGTFPATLSAVTRGAVFSFTGDNDDQLQVGLDTSLAGAITVGNANTYAFRSIFTGTTNNGMNVSVYGSNTGVSNSSGYGVGTIGEVFINSPSKNSVGLWGGASSVNAGSGKNIGVYGVSGSNGVTPTYNYGVMGVAGQATNRFGGYFVFDTATYSSALGPIPLAHTGTAALVADNGSVAANIFEARDNGTAVVTIADGGATTFTQQTTHSSGVVVGSNFALSSAGLGYLYGLTSLTPDAPAWNTATTSESLHFFQLVDNGFDFNNGACGTSACTDPSLIIHSAVQDTTQYNHLSNWGQAGGAIKTLTESAATSVVRIPIANLAGAFGKFCYTVKAADATDSQIRGSCIKYTVTAKAGTETCSLNTESATVSDASITETEDGSGSGAITTGTLTYAITCDTTPANAVDLQINAVSSLTQTTLNIQYNLNHVGPGQPARQ